MAEIAVERKHRIPWWGWLLIIVAAILVIWGVYEAFNRNRGVEAAGPPAVEETTQGMAITDVSTIYSAADPTSLIGREVAITHAPVVSVAGDRMFWIGQGEGQQVLVVTDEKHPDISAGQTVNVNGKVEKMPDWNTIESQWNADPLLRSSLESQRVYVKADRLEMPNQP